MRQRVVIHGVRRQFQDWILSLTEHELARVEEDAEALSEKSMREIRVRPFIAIWAQRYKTPQYQKAAMILRDDNMDNPLWDALSADSYRAIRSPSPFERSTQNFFISQQIFILAVLLRKFRKGRNT